MCIVASFHHQRYYSRAFCPPSPWTMYQRSSDVNGYCLGHLEFIAAVCAPTKIDDLIISGSTKIDDLIISG